MKKIYILFIVLIGLFHNSCTDLDADIYSEILPENYFETEAQLASFSAAAYGAMQNAWALHELADLPSDQSTVPVRASGGWNDGGIWPRLMRHEFNSLDYVGARWNHWSGGIATCNRLIESLSATLDPDDPAIAELRGLRAYYFYVLADLFGNIPLETRFAEADPLPSQSTPAEAFAFIESELLEAIPNMTESTAAYAKMNKWVAYTVLANLYTNAERFGAGPHYSEAADAAAAVIESTAYSLEPLYFSNFITENEGSSENIFVVPYDRS